ncbi:MAG: PGF-pre-PGF domain-containing protein [Nanoarchaeota archaeon]|nr:PGF-pre-PGF domain-containing protein [Nanoarchaeota archaeon]
MKKLFLLLVVVSFAIFIAPSLANAACNGVTICGVNYTCGVSDGVCPEDFSACDRCSTCDPDCGPCGGVGAAGGGGEQTYRCRADFESYYIFSLEAGGVFSTIEDRYCTDLHLYKLKVSNPIKDATTKVVLIEPEVIPPEGKVYNYYNFSVDDMKNSDVDVVEFRYRVPNEWISNNSVAEDRVVLYKQRNVFWERLDSERLGKDEQYNYYSAKSNSFGVYAIVGHGLEIWDVLEKISLYYSGDIDFIEVLHVIDMYYSF